MADDLSHTASKRKDRTPLQFSVRSFFVIALVLSLYLGAIKGLTGWNLFLALSILTWLTWGAVLVRFRAMRPLLAMAIGPVLLALCWAASMAVIDSGGELGAFEPITLITVAFALSWGCAVSLFVILAAGLEHWTRCLSLRPAPCEKKRLPCGPGAPPRSWIRFALVAAVVRIGFSAAVWPAAFSGREWVRWIAYATNFILDMPYVPLFMDCVQEPSTFGESVHFVISTGICGAALYAMLGALVARASGFWKKQP